MAISLKEGIYWVGGIDWDLRNFHGYLTQRGSTYNAYLIIDEKITLVDTVKGYLTDEMIDRISQVVDPSKIDYIISNHVEMDHSGGLPKIMEIAKNATIVTSPNGEKGLNRHYKKEWKYKIVKSGDVLNLGKRNLQFLLMPMVHWPDSMASYLVEDKILLPNDALGQHLASFERFDDEYPIDIIMEEAKKYYANIVLPFGSQVQAVLKAVENLEIDMVAPSHGIIWRKYIGKIVEEYKKWSSNQTEEKAVIIYDTMWGSTENIAHAIKNAFESKNISYKMLNLRHNHISDIMTDVITAKYICVGSPTLNNTILPTVSSFLTYLKGLAPKNRTALAFGSYGWGGQSIGEVESVLNSCKFEILPQIKVNYIPDKEELIEITNNLKELL